MTASLLNSTILRPTTPQEIAVLAAVGGKSSLPEAGMQLDLITDPDNPGQYAIQVSQTLDVEALYERIEPKGSVGPGRSREDAFTYFEWDDYTHEQEYFQDDEEVPAPVTDMKQTSLFAKLRAFFTR